MITASQWLLVLTLLFVGCGAVLALVTGVTLLLFPNSLKTLEGSSRDFFSFLGRSVKVERFFYRHHRFFGVMILLGSLFILGTLWGFVNPDQVSLQIAATGRVERWLWESLTLILAFCSFFALLCGLLILFRPSLLRPLEVWANQPVTGEMMRSTIHRGHRNLLRLLLDNPALLASLLILGGGFMLFYFIDLLALFSVAWR